jgi:hypothetical protein
MSTTENKNMKVEKTIKERLSEFNHVNINLDMINFVDESILEKLREINEEIEENARDYYYIEDRKWHEFRLAEDRSFEQEKTRNNLKEAKRLNKEALKALEQARELLGSDYESSDSD